MVTWKLTKKQGLRGTHTRRTAEVRGMKGSQLIQSLRTSGGLVGIDS